MYAFQKVYQKIETFIFSTQIARITNELNTNHFNEVKANFSEKINIWSGGTKIGQSLSQFNQEFGKRYVNHQTVVIILSDGWETGNPEILANAMETLHNKRIKSYGSTRLLVIQTFKQIPWVCKWPCHISATSLSITSKVSNNWEK
jgi:uncharacterized protein with von Willebrand factor type A (vWA) domain